MPILIVVENPIGRLLACENGCSKYMAILLFMFRFWINLPRIIALYVIMLFIILRE